MLGYILSISHVLPPLILTLTLVAIVSPSLQSGLVSH